MQNNITLPPHHIFRTPMPLVADAYTIGSNDFQSEAAKTRSAYYLTFRRRLWDIDKSLYKEGDNRIVFVGLPRILEKLFYRPVTHDDIDESLRFLSTAKVTTQGLQPYNFPEKEWRRVVNDFAGRPPISIRAMPEGSVVYPNEPVLAVESLVDGLTELLGELAAWFESKLAHTWSGSERVTQGQHWLEEMKRMVRRIEPDLTEDEVKFKASTLLTDFGDRASMSAEESEEQGRHHLLTFSGTDTFCGGYQAWKDANETPGLCMSVLALAHRNVQAYEHENDCYVRMYEVAKNGEILSMVADCNDFYYAGENYLLPLALRSKKEGSGKVIVVRPDSGDAMEQVTWICRLAKRHGLYTERVINGKTWYMGTSFKFIEGDSMTFSMMRAINEKLIEQGFPPYDWGLYGCGGALRNNLKRDNLSAKFALCAIAGDSAKYDGWNPVVKFSEDIGKTTLPGPHKVLRSVEALAARKTVVFAWEPGKDAMVEYFNGCNVEHPFGKIMWENFLDTKARIADQFPRMPLTLETDENHNYPVSEAIRQKRYELLAKYAPKKRKENY